MEQFQTALLEQSGSALGLSAALKGSNQQISVRLVGQGTVGALTLEPSSIDFGTVAVGFPAVREITLLNQSGGNLQYSVTCKVLMIQPGIESAAAAGSASEDQHRDSALHLAIEEPTGHLPARATKTLRLTLNPIHRQQYTLQMVCHTATASSSSSQDSSTALSTAALLASLTAPPVCASIAAFSTYPTVQITDVACQGVDKTFVWKQLSCSRINTELAAEMTQVNAM